MGPDRLPGPQPTSALAREETSASGKLLVREAISTRDERALAVLRPRSVAAKSRLERIVSGRGPHDEPRDVAIVAEREARGREPLVQRTAEPTSAPRWRSSDSCRHDVLSELVELDD